MTTEVRSEERDPNDCAICGVHFGEDEAAAEVFVHLYHALPPDTREAGLNEERLAEAMCAANIGHYRGWDAAESHATVEQDHGAAARAVAREYVALAAVPRPEHGR